MTRKILSIMVIKRVIVLLLCCLFFTLIPLGCTAPQLNTSLSTVNAFDAELPQWTIGDSWTYSLSVNGIRGDTVDFDLTMDPFRFEVVDVNGDESYTVEFTVPRGDVTGVGRVDLDLISLEGALTNTYIDGSLTIDQSTLSIIGGEGTMQGYIDKLIDIPFSIDFLLEFYNATGTPTTFSSLQFPFSVGDRWTYPFTYIVFNASFSVLPEPNLVFFFREEHAFECVGWESVEVDAGRYDALLVSGDQGGTTNIWYAPAAGNVVQLQYTNVNLGYGTVIQSLEMTLTSTTYQVDTLPPLQPNPPEGPVNVAVGDTVSYQVTTTDPDGDDVLYIVDWGDGDTTQTQLYPSGDLVTVSHSWSQKGTYNVKVKAQDVYGAESTWSDNLVVTVHNEAPAQPSKPQGPATGNIHETYTYTTSSTDPDGHKIKYYFDWGDGTNSWTNLVNSGETAQASHTWSSEGTYQIRVKAVDQYGEESPWSDPLSVTMPKSKDSSAFASWVCNHYPRLYRYLCSIFERWNVFDLFS
jgi:hypothetical protein